MITLPTTTLTKPVGDEKISRGTLGYVLARNRQQAYDLIITELKKSGIPQAALARRLDMDPGELSRLLKRPGNWQTNTFGALLFAICGAALKFGASYPSDDQHRSDISIAQSIDSSERAHKQHDTKAASGPRTAIEANNNLATGRAHSIRENERSFINELPRRQAARRIPTRKINEDAMALV